MIRRVDIESAGWTAIALASLAVIGASSCEEFGPRVYTAQRYRPDLGCLETYAPLGLIEAKDLGALCAPVCLSRGDELFVSTVCPPYPTTTSPLEPQSESCAAALAAPSCDEPDDDGSSDAGLADADSADAAAP
jgi:hypothetical protein